MDQSTFWSTAIPQYGAVKKLAVAGVSNYDVSSDLRERPSANEVLLPGERAVGWASVAGMTEGDEIEFIWKRPNGSVFATNQHEFDDVNWLQPIVWAQTIPDDANVGEWEIEYRVNGQRLGVRTFEVRTSGSPEIRIERLNEIVIDERFTPFDFGSISPSESSSKLFQIQNHGSSDLFVSAVELPVGFVAREIPTTPIPPGGLGILTVVLDTNETGFFSGDVVVHSNDSDERLSIFRVEGRVSEPNLEEMGIYISEREIGRNSRLIGRIELAEPAVSDLPVTLSAGSSDLLLPSQVVVPAGETSRRFVIEARGIEDSATSTITARTNGFAAATTEVSMVGNTGSWQNSADATDVDDNGVVSPLDALLVINELNERDISDELTGAITVTTESPPPFLDVDGNGLISPLDALLVINALPSSQAASARVVVVPLSSASTVQEDEVSQNEWKHDIWDALFSKLGTDELSL